MFVSGIAWSSKCPCLHPLSHSRWKMPRNRCVTLTNYCSWMQKQLSCILVTSQCQYYFLRFYLSDNKVYKFTHEFRPQPSPSTPRDYSGMLIEKPTETEFNWQVWLTGRWTNKQIQRCRETDSFTSSSWIAEVLDFHVRCTAARLLAYQHASCSRSQIPLHSEGLYVHMNTQLGVSNWLLSLLFWTCDELPIWPRSSPDPFCCWHCTNSNTGIRRHAYVWIFVQLK